MEYLHTLKGWNELQCLFTNNGYLLFVDLANEVVITTISGNDVEYDTLPEMLKNALNAFYEANNTNN